MQTGLASLWLCAFAFKGRIQFYELEMRSLKRKAATPLSGLLASELKPTSLKPNARFPLTVIM